MGKDDPFRAIEKPPQGDDQEKSPHRDVEDWNRMAGRDDPFRAIEKRPQRDDQEKSTPRDAEDWNRTAARRREAPISAEERAERQRIANPTDGIGCPFGKNPTHQAYLDAKKRFSEELKEQLKDPKAKVIVKGYASAVGAKEFNLRLSQQRAEKIAAELRSDPEVKAKIIAQGYGSEEALSNGRPPDKDNSRDRIVLINGLEDEESPDKPESAPEKAKPMPDKLEGPVKTEIPKQFASDYIMSREKAETLLHIFSYNFGRGYESGFGMPSKEFLQKETDEWYRTLEDIDAEKSVDEKLWNRSPWPGFMLDMAKDRSNQTTVREWLHQAGYDDKKMFKEWVIHWIRKGAS